MDGTTLGIISAVGTGLVAAIGALWSQSKKREAEDREKSKSDDLRYHNQQGSLLEITKEVGELRGKISIATSIHPKLEKIEEVMNQVVEEVSKNKCVKNEKK